MWLKVKKCQQEFIIGGIYRHPTGSIEEFSKKLDSVLGKIPPKYNSIVLGDLNIKLLNHSTNTQIKNYLEMLTSNSVLPSLLLPTRIKVNIKVSQHN